MNDLPQLGQSSHKSGGGNDAEGRPKLVRSMSVNVGSREPLFAHGDPAVHLHDELNAGENSQVNNIKNSSCKLSESSASVSSSDVEFFDAPDATLNNYGSDEDVTQTICMHQPHSNLSGDPGLSSTAQLQLEIQRRVKAETALMILQQQQDNIARRLSTAGLILPSDENLTTSSMHPTLPDWDFSNQINQKLIVVRLTSSAVARGVVKAEIEERLDALLASKNCEISRLQENLQCYELVNHTMFQRQRELIETAKRRKRRHKKRLQIALSCVAAAVSLISVAIV